MPSGRDRPLSNTDPPSCNSSALTSRRAFALLVPEPTFSERLLQWLLFATRHFCRFGPFLTSTAPSAGGITPFLQNCRLTVSGRYGAQPHVVTEHVIHLSVRHLPNYCILYTPFRLLSTAALAKSCQNPRKNWTGTHLPCVPALVFRKETFHCYPIICALTPPGTSVRQRSYPLRRSASRSRRTRSCRCAGTPCARRGPRRSS